ncbi:hypothetical protein DID80_08380, partial [Candidatus Marinamargulisbacteria bacterium SCGC AAA071-K20]
MKKLLLVVLGLLLTTGLFASDYNMFYHIGTSAKSIALGGTQLSSNTSGSLFENPASASYEKWTIDSFYTNIMDNEHTFFSGSAGFKWGNYRLMMGAYRSSISDIAQTDRPNGIIVQTGTFGYYNQLLKVGVQRQVRERLSFGLS